LYDLGCIDFFVRIVFCCICLLLYFQRCREGSNASVLSLFICSCMMIDPLWVPVATLSIDAAAEDSIGIMSISWWPWFSRCWVHKDEIVIKSFLSLILRYRCLHTGPS